MNRLTNDLYVSRSVEKSWNNYAEFLRKIIKATNICQFTRLYSTMMEQNSILMVEQTPRVIIMVI